MNKIRQCLALGLERGTRLTALRLSLVVGSLLVLINHGDAILDHRHLEWGKIFLTYLVPYGVSTYTSVKKDLATEIQTTQKKQGA